jgi:hypothetical protein
MNLSVLSNTLAEAAALPPGNQNGMVISLPGVLSHAQRALTEMILPFGDEDIMVDTALLPGSPTTEKTEMPVSAGALRARKKASESITIKLLPKLVIGHQHQTTLNATIK